MRNLLSPALLLALGIAAVACAAEEPTLEWPQWGGSSLRNNTPVGVGIPTEWNVGEFDPVTGEWDSTTAKNIKWVARLGSQTYGNAVVADGKVFVGSNNSGALHERYPGSLDLSCLLAFDAETGKFLWQHSSEKLKAGNVQDEPLRGVSSTPLVEGERLWFVTSRGEVVCLDTEGFRDGENDAPALEEDPTDLADADVIGAFDMMRELGVSQHSMSNCSVTALGNTLLVNTSNGVDESHRNLAAPDAPSFIALDKNSGELLWSDNSPGKNILHGQWSSPACGVLTGSDGEPQVQAIFCGGDGWVYSFDPAGDGKGNAKLLWRFDANPKDSVWKLGSQGTRNNLLATPVIDEGLVYIAVGQDPEHGEGVGHLWCIDPSKQGDVSPEQVFSSTDPSAPLPHRRLQAIDLERDEVARPNPNSAVVWHYSEQDRDGDGDIAFEEIFHRSCSTVAIKGGILYIADLSGLFHCLDAASGKVHWVYNMESAVRGSPLIVEGKVYIGDEAGDIAIFRHSADPTVAMREEEGKQVPHYGQINMGSSVYSTPIVANNVLYIANQNYLFAIIQKEE